MKVCCIPYQTTACRIFLHIYMCYQTINHIQNISFCLHSICVCTVYIYYVYIYIYTQTSMHIFKTTSTVVSITYSLCISYINLIYTCNIFKLKLYVCVYYNNINKSTLVHNPHYIWCKEKTFILDVINPD